MKASSPLIRTYLHRAAVLGFFAALLFQPPRLCLADIDKDALEILAQREGREAATEVNKPVAGAIDPDGPNAPHFKPSAEMTQQAQSIAGGLPLGALGLSPDAVSKITLPGPVGAVADVLFYNDQQTSSASNEGIKAYVSAAVSSEDSLYSASLRLYSRLRTFEARTPSARIHSPIQEHAPFDIYRDYALPAAHGNPYVALKALLVFGQDNMQHTIPGEGWRITEMNTFDPGTNSILYLNGAVGPQYTAEDVSAGQAIAAQCRQPGISSAEWLLCNDMNSDYQGDYYHVITAAFLGCRQDILAKRDKSFLGRMAMASGLVERGYLASVRRYKLDRFIETARQTSAGAVSTMVLAALERAGSGLEPVHLDLTSSEWRSLNERERGVVKAILDRQNFEIEFRVRQHAMGMAFGRQACKSLTSFDGSTARNDLPRAPEASELREAKALDRSGAATSRSAPVPARPRAPALAAG